MKSILCLYELMLSHSVDIPLTSTYRHTHMKEIFCYLVDMKSVHHLLSICTRIFLMIKIYKTNLENILSESNMHQITCTSMYRWPEHEYTAVFFIRCIVIQWHIQNEKKMSWSSINNDNYLSILPPQCFVSNSWLRVCDNGQRFFMFCEGWYDWSI